jgi:hypothetical protein
MAGTLMERARTSTRDPSTFHDPRHAAIIQGQTEQRLQDGAPRAPGVPLEVAREQRGIVQTLDDGWRHAAAAGAWAERAAR